MRTRNQIESMQMRHVLIALDERIVEEYETLIEGCQFNVAIFEPTADLPSRVAEYGTVTSVQKLTNIHILTTTAETDA